MGELECGCIRIHQKVYSLVISHSTKKLVKIVSNFQPPNGLYDLCMLYRVKIRGTLREVRVKLTTAGSPH